MKIWWCEVHAASGASVTCHAWQVAKATWSENWEPDPRVVPRCHMMEAELTLVPHEPEMTEPLFVNRNGMW